MFTFVKRFEGPIYHVEQMTPICIFLDLFGLIATLSFEGQLGIHNSCFVVILDTLVSLFKCCWINNFLSKCCKMPWSFGAIVGSAAGGLALLVMFAVLIWLYLFRGKGFSNKASETGSSDPSTVVEWNRTAGISSSSGALEHQGARQFSLEELEQATIKFSEHNLVGAGSFGLVYKGLLLDGTVVAIKKRERAPRQEFIEEVMILSAIRHRNLATLIGYCQDAGLQMLVFEYLPNGSICSHLFGKDQSTKLEFKQRLSIAIGAAKGLAHLHSLSPPIIHRNFKTSNVLVDENFIAKVSDAGLVKLLERFDETGPSQVSGRGIFCDTELGELGVQYETTDAYSFGAFLLELITGREVERLMVEVPSESLAQLPGS